MNQIFFILIILVLLLVIIAFNKFISLLNLTNSAWADIDVQLKKRYDLIPRLVDMVKTYSKHEKTLFEEIAKARNLMINAPTVVQKGEADESAALSLNKVFALAENYPALKASENFLKLQQQFTDTENTIAFARRFYNGCVRDLNSLLSSFPFNILAKILNLKKKDFFQIALDQKNISSIKSI